MSVAGTHKRLKFKISVLTCLLILLLVVAAQCKKDYYKILGVSRGADENEVKKAYKRLSKKYHPDRVEFSQKDAAKKKFMEISEAYQVLKDKEKRQIYDQGGDEAVKDYEQNQNNPGAGGGFRGGPFGGFGFGGGGFGGGGFGKGAGGMHFNIEDLFGNFDPFGGSQGHGGGRRRKQEQRGQHEDGFDDFSFNPRDKKAEISFKDSDVLVLGKGQQSEITARRKLTLGVFFNKKSLVKDEVVSS